MEIENSDKVLLQKAIARLNGANEILQFISDHFRDKYHITPGQQITPDGQIISSAGDFQLPLQQNGSVEHDSYLPVM